jgi:predicted metal-binding protein
LIVPRVKLLTDTTKNMGRDIEVLHLGTCMKSAMETAGCPLDYGEVKTMLEKKFGVEVVLGTYSNAKPPA